MYLFVSDTLESKWQKIVWLVLYHLLLLMVVWSYYQTVMAPMAQVPQQVSKITHIMSIEQCQDVSTCHLSLSSVIWECSTCSCCLSFPACDILVALHQVLSLPPYLALCDSDNPTLRLVVPRDLL